MNRFKHTIWISGILSITLLLSGCKITNKPIIPQDSDFESISTAVRNAALLQQDTDRDGYADVVELLAGSDPNKKEKFNRSNAVEFSFKSEEATLKLKGTPNIVNTYTGEYTLADIRNKSILLSPVYELYNPNFQKDIYEAELTLTFRGEPDSDVAIYQYMDDGSLQIVENSVVSGNKVTAKLEHFSKYTVARRVLEDISTYKERAFAICVDDSGSMFENVMQADDKNMHGNDPDGKRWEFIREFFNKYSEDEIYCCNYTADAHDIVTFASRSQADKIIMQHIDYVKQIADASIEAVFDVVDGLQDSKISFTGTDTSSATIKAINELSTINALSKYLIIITDGNDTSTYYHKKYQTLIDSSPDITPIVIILGKDVNIKTAQLYSEPNNGQIIRLSDADVFSQLDDIFSRVIVGEDEEVSARLSECFKREINAVTLADSGYRKEKNSIPFLNTSFCMDSDPVTGLNGGLCFGYAYTEQERYLTGLVHSSKKSYTVNAITAAYSKYTNFSYNKISLRYLSSSNYDEVLNYLSSIISAHNNQSYMQFIIDNDGTLTRTLKNNNSPLVRNFFGCISKDADEKKGEYFCDSSGKIYMREIRYFPNCTLIQQAVESNFRDYPELSDLDKACLEWLNLLFYNFNIQVRGIGHRALSDSCYSDTTTVGGWIGEQFADFLSGYEGDGYFGHTKEYFTALLSIYNQLKAGIPAILGINYTEVNEKGEKKEYNHELLCSRMFRDIENPTIFYLEIDDSNSVEPQYFEIRYGTVLCNISQAISGMTTIEKLNLEDPYSVCYSKFLDGEVTGINRLVVQVDTEALKKFATDI